MAEKEGKPDLSQTASQDVKPKIHITVNFEGRCEHATNFTKIFEHA
jgi:hypothetical protein